MSAAVFKTTDTPIPIIESEIDDRHGWGFVLLLATTATLFVRPADLVPALNKWPIYQVLIVSCVVVSARACLNQLSNARLVGRPTTVSLIVLIIAVGASHLSHGFFWAARMSMMEVGKLIVLYVLITGLVNTPARLRYFTRWLVVAISTMATLVLLDHFGVISIAALESISDRGVMQDGLTERVERIRGTGIFQDPNDFGLILVTGIVLCVSYLTKPDVGIIRYVWLAPAAILLGALGLTHSRGALLSLMCAVSTVLCYFRGGKYALLVVPSVPLMALAFSSRMSDFSAIREGTGQDRIQIWSESLGIWRQYPLFGLGEGLIVDEIGVVSHNSFLQCYAELGFFGGTAFLSSFLAAGLGLWAQRTWRCDRDDTLNRSTPETLEHRRQCGFLFAALMGCVAAMLTISRQFVAPTYLILGLVSAANFIPQHTRDRGDYAGLRFGNRFVALSLIASVATLMTFYVAIRLLVHW